MSDGGKGSAQRPRSVSSEEWSSRWDAIFQQDFPVTKQLPASLIEGIMSAESCVHPDCGCKDVCKEAK